MVAPLGHDGANPHVAPPRVRGADEDGGVPTVAAPLAPAGLRHDVNVGERVVDRSVEDLDAVEALYPDVARLLSLFFLPVELPSAYDVRCGTRYG